MSYLSICLKTDIINHSFTKNRIPFKSDDFKPLFLNSYSLPTISNIQKHPPFIKSYSLPIKFNKTLNIKKCWNNVPLYSGPLGSNHSTLFNIKAKISKKKCDNYVYKHIPFPEIKNLIIHNYIIEPQNTVKLNIPPHPIISRYPDKYIGGRFLTETKRQFKKYNSRFYKQISKYSKTNSNFICCSI